MDRSEFEQRWSEADGAARDRLREEAEGSPEWSAWIAFEDRLDRAVMDLAPRMPTDAWAELLARHREENPPPSGLRELESAAAALPTAVRVLPWRTWVVAASLLLAAVATWSGLQSRSNDGEDRDPVRGAVSERGPSPRALPGLLDDVALDEARGRQEELQMEHALLVSTTRSDTSLGEARSPLLEEIRFLDEAISECERALDANSHHRHLRERLLELSERRNDLLSTWNQESKG